MDGFTESVHTQKIFEINLYGTIMKNKWVIFVLHIFIALIIINLPISAQTLTDDSKVKRFEVGGQFTILRRSDADTTAEVFSLNGFGSRNYISSKLNELGFGGRFTFNFTKNIAVESEANFFRKLENPPPVIGVGRRVSQPGGRKFQAVLGPKIGIRKERFGVFGKIRPGFIQIDKYNITDQVGPPGNNFFTASHVEKVTFFNVDIGGVFEYYPSRRTIVRVDVGDTIIRYSSFPPKEINPSFTRHNLQTSVGFGFRF